MPIHNDDSNLSSSNPISSVRGTDAKAPVIPSALSPEAQLKLEVIESLLAAADRRSYTERLFSSSILGTTSCHFTETVWYKIWATRTMGDGLPPHFYTDGGKDFRSDHLQQIGVQLVNVQKTRRPFGVRV